MLTDSTGPDFGCNRSVLSDSPNDTVTIPTAMSETARDSTFALKDVNSVRLFCQFFNIPTASFDDIKFILIARMNGLETAKALADGFGWQCDAARQALDGMFNGGGVFQSISRD
jgi:hypothetical protein